MTKGIEREVFEKALAGNNIHNLKVCTIFDDEKNEYFASDLCDPSEDHIVESINLSWRMWQAAKAQAAPEGRTDFEIINQTIELVDLLALSTNVFQRDPKSKVHPFESENPRVMEWWRTACQIQELLTNTDPDNCDFEEYKAMIEAQEPAK